MGKITSAVRTSLVLARLSCKYQLLRASASSSLHWVGCEVRDITFLCGRAAPGSRHSLKLTWEFSRQIKLCSANLLCLRGNDPYFKLVTRDVLENHCPGLSQFWFATLGPYYFRWVCHHAHIKKEVLLFPYIPDLHLLSVRREKKKRKNRQKGFHMWMISSDSLIICIDKELEGGAGSWYWSSRINLISVHNGLLNDTSFKVKYSQNEIFFLNKTKHWSDWVMGALTSFKQQKSTHFSSSA